MSHLCKVKFFMNILILVDTKKQLLDFQATFEQLLEFWINF